MRTGIVCFIYCCINFWHSIWHSMNICWMELRNSNGETEKWEKGLIVEVSKCHTEARKLSSQSLSPKPSLCSCSCSLFRWPWWDLFSFPPCPSLPATRWAPKVFHSSLYPQQLAQGQWYKKNQPALARSNAPMENNTQILTMVYFMLKVHCKCSWVSKAAAFHIMVGCTRQLLLCKHMFPSSTGQG